MIISDEKYRDLQLKAISLQDMLNKNVIDSNLAKDLVNTILNLQSDQPDIPVPQPILTPKEQLNKIFGSEAFNNQPKRELTEDILTPYSIYRLFAEYLKDTYDIDKPFLHR